MSSGSDSNIIISANPSDRRGIINSLSQITATTTGITIPVSTATGSYELYLNKAIAFFGGQTTTNILLGTLNASLAQNTVTADTASYALMVSNIIRTFMDSNLTSSTDISDFTFFMLHLVAVYALGITITYGTTVLLKPPVSISFDQYTVIISNIVASDTMTSVTMSLVATAMSGGSASQIISGIVTTLAADAPEIVQAADVAITDVEKSKGCSCFS